jgi:hypothetical protein
VDELMERAVADHPGCRPLDRAGVEPMPRSGGRTLAEATMRNILVTSAYRSMIRALDWDNTAR